MKSHFCITIWKWNGTPITELIDKANYFDFEPVFDKMIEVGRMCRMHYGCWSVEDSRLKVPECTGSSGSAATSNSDVEQARVQENKSLGQDALSFMTKIRNSYSSEVAVPAISSVTQKGGLHIHYYIELNRTIRWTTVVNKFTNAGFDGVHVEVRKGWRETCREYHMGIKNYSPKIDTIISGEWGKWREDLGTSYSKEDYFELAANMIIHGYNPSQVAMRFPTWYIRHGYGIERLHNALNRDNWD